MLLQPQVDHVGNCCAFHLGVGLYPSYAGGPRSGSRARSGSCSAARKAAHKHFLAHLSKPICQNKAKQMYKQKLGKTTYHYMKAAVTSVVDECS